LEPNSVSSGDGRPPQPRAHWRALERMYLAAPVNAYYQPSIEIGDGRARINMPVRPSSFHAAGALHGSVYFKALDDAAFFASQSIEQEAFVLTARFELELLSPVTRGVLEAHGEVVERGERIEATATLEVGSRPVASGRGTFARGGTLLAEVPAYQLSEQLLA
jgi:uncharacterized protein (TIGR00369 family)